MTNREKLEQLRTTHICVVDNNTTIHDWYISQKCTIGCMFRDYNECFGYFVHSMDNKSISCAIKNRFVERFKIDIKELFKI